MRQKPYWAGRLLNSPRSDSLTNKLKWFIWIDSLLRNENGIWIPIKYVALVLDLLLVLLAALHHFDGTNIWKFEP